MAQGFSFWLCLVFLWALRGNQDLLSTDTTTAHENKRRHSHLLQPWSCIRPHGGTFVTLKPGKGLATVLQSILPSTHSSLSCLRCTAPAWPWVALLSVSQMKTGGSNNSLVGGKHQEPHHMAVIVYSYGAQYLPPAGTSQPYLSLVQAWI